MMLSTDNRTFIDKRGRSVPTASSFIDPLSSPRQGWNAKIVINEVEHTVSGRDARHVFSEAKKYLVKNSVEITDENLWFTLNFQWAKKTPDVRLIVSRELILNAVIDNVYDKDAEYFPPSTWGRIEWLSLGLYLSLPVKDFSYGTFMSRLEHTLLLLNPVQVSHLGCAICYKEFSSQVASLRRKNLTRDECRDWLFSFHNEVNHRLNKSILTFEQASEINRWI